MKQTSAADTQFTAQQELHCLKKMKMIQQQNMKMYSTGIQMRREVKAAGFYDNRSQTNKSTLDFAKFSKEW